MQRTHQLKPIAFELSNSLARRQALSFCLAGIFIIACSIHVDVLGQKEAEIIEVQQERETCSVKSAGSDRADRKLECLGWHRETKRTLTWTRDLPSA